MRNVFKKSFVFAATAALLFSAQAQAGKAEKKAAAPQEITKEWTKQTIKDWPETAKSAATNMLEKYGAPDEATPNLLIWRDNGPWKRTLVYKEEIQHNFPMPHKDVLEQVVNMDVPADKFDELAAFDGSVIVERTKGEVSARCDKEAANILALNLANDIISGKKNVEQARQAYAENIKAMLQGNTQPYMKNFQFSVAKTDVNNPDKTVLDKKAIMSGATAE